SLISARRHSHSLLAVMRVPFVLVKGSGSRELDDVEPGETLQSAPSNSELASYCASASGVSVAASAVMTLGTSIAAPTASAAIATSTARSWERPKLMSIRAPFG